MMLKAIKPSLFTPRSILATSVLFATFLFGGAVLAAEGDWPTFGGDFQRSDASPSGLALPLAEAWVHSAALPPEPAWPAPAEANRSAKEYGLSPTLTYDRAFQTVAVGDNVYFASSSEDSITCLSAKSGAERWVFQTEGPVRLAPTVVDGRVYAGSDDGYLYCLDAQSGALLWKHRAGPEDKRLPGNGRMISIWPVRCGVVVEDGLVYFTSGLFPLRGVALNAIDAKTGKPFWTRKIDISPQGYLLASPSRLFIPTGRTPFRAFDRKNGAPLAKFGKSTSWGRDLVGGTHAILIDKTLATGPSEDGQIHLFDATTRERLISTPGIRLIAKEGMAYILKKEKITAMDRENYVRLAQVIRDLQNRKRKLEDSLKKTKAKDSIVKELAALKVKNTALVKEQRACIKWEVPCDTPHSMVLLGDTLFTGGENKVVARNARDGKIIWQSAVKGKAYGLARSGERLLVSTDQGQITCFAPGATKTALTTTATDEKSIPPYPDNSATYAAVAKSALSLADAKKGYCLVLGASDGRLAWEIARSSGLRVVAALSDEKKAAAARRATAQAGLGGQRLSVHAVDPARLPYPDYFANLIVIDALTTDAPDFKMSEALRLLRPCGGVIAMVSKGALGIPKTSYDLEWKTVEEGAVKILNAKRPALPEAGEWTHMYADAGNTACSDDQLVKGALDLQWFGRPGPRRMVDRHRRAPAPLVCDGRIFITGMDYVAGVDAYNGTVLWENTVPSSHREGLPWNTSNMVVTKDSLYVAAAGECIRFDTRTGSEIARFNSVPQAPAKAEWRFISQAGKLLLGSLMSPGEAPAPQNGKGRGRSVACSNQFFALDRYSGEPCWSYTPRRGAILDSTIAIDAGRVVFVESANPKSLNSANGNELIVDLLDPGANIVALNLKTGKELWRKPVDLKAFRYVIHLTMAKETILITGTNHKNINGDDHIRYDQLAFDAKTGDALWTATQSPKPYRLAEGHGVERQHPAIVGDVVYGPGFACDLRTGKPHPGWKWVKDRKCGTVSMSAHTAFSRFDRTLNPYAFDLQSGQKQAMTSITRPGCWINMIPAGGLVLVPEASSGCTCGHPYSIQTSLALRPIAGTN